MTLPSRQYAGLALVAAAGLSLALRAPRPEPDAGAVEQLPEVVHLRIHAKARVVRGAIDGRRPLLEAAALFRELDRVPPAAVFLPEPIPLRPPAPLRTDEERCCWCVVAWAWAGVTRAADSGDVAALHRAEAAASRLAAEFAELCRRGPVRLPDPSGLEPVDALLAQARAEWKAQHPR